MFSKAKQKNLADSILHGAFLIDAAHPKVGQVYQTMVRRRGPEFVEQVKQLESDAFDGWFARDFMKDVADIERKRKAKDLQRKKK
jgi:hypothetical protein